MGGFPVRLEGDCGKTPGVGHLGRRECGRQAKWSLGVSATSRPPGNFPTLRWGHVPGVRR